METTYILVYEDPYGDLYQPALIIAACFAFTASVFSILLIFQHLRSYTNPAEQKWVVAVLLMVPIYATESILALWNPSLSMACDILRNCYEAFALYSFGSYLIACLGGERRVMELLDEESEKLLSKPLLEGEVRKPKSEVKTLCNFFLQPCVLGKDLLTIEKFGLVQYMAIAAVAHVYVFSAQPYQLLPVSEYGKVTTQEKLTLVEKSNKERPTILEKTETGTEAPGTSVKESIQDIVVEGGQHVVKDVVLTINQAIEPMGKGVTKIQETFQHISVASGDEKEELEVIVEEHDDEEKREVKLEEHMERTSIS